MLPTSGSWVKYLPSLYLGRLSNKQYWAVQCLFLSSCSDTYRLVSDCVSKKEGELGGIACSSACYRLPERLLSLQTIHNFNVAFKLLGELQM